LQGEVEIGGSVVARRLVPFWINGENSGGLVLVQDVTEVRRRDKMVLYKDAVIREIHHRVKNNLQTTASLLRLQSRRIRSPEGKAALEESVRRISAIALVHENLSQATTDLVDFSEVLRGILRMLEDALGLTEQGVRMELEGREISELPAVVATPLALVVNELVQNAAEHAFVGRDGGTIRVSLDTDDESLSVVVADDGIGIPEGQSNESGLGLRIVQLLVEGELSGTIKRTVDEGTRFEVVLPLPSGPR
jgi:two-component sensor histidine kinase